MYSAWCMLYAQQYVHYGWLYPTATIRLAIRPWESPTLLDLSRPPLRSGYKMLFDMRTLEGPDEKDISTVRAKVEECYSKFLTSRMLYCDEAQSGSPGLTCLEVTSKVAQIMYQCWTHLDYSLPQRLLSAASHVATCTNRAHAVLTQL